jgi:hypothetical protein
MTLTSVMVTVLSGAISAAASLIIHCSKVSYAVTPIFPEVTASSMCRASHDVASRPAACTRHRG